MMERKAEINRKTRETEINVKLKLDGTGNSQVETGVGFFDHMLELMAKHGLI
ncbi:MAG: imidazoleglycerol-phosphate dehydratase, partial [Clostridiaceae bacterium]|nr:imidazoleglycerol-phosphate dehydratase [Clostridiaceae bacterium]